MIYPFVATAKGTKDRIPFAYNGFTFNDETVDFDPRAASGTECLVEVNVVAINEQWDAVTEPKVTTHGMEGYEPKKVVAMVRLDGLIRAPRGNLGLLMDTVRDMNAAFDPVNAYHADSGTINKGYLPLTFSIPTADLANYPSGFITAEYYVRSLNRPIVRDSQFEGDTCRFQLLLQAIDPRCYYTVAQTNSRSNAGTVAVDNSLAGFPSWPILTFTVTGAGSGNVDITHDGDGGSVALRLSLTSLTAAQVMVVNMERRTITVDGVSAMSRYVSGPWLEQPVDNTTWTFANVTGTLAATVLVAWSRAL